VSALVRLAPLLLAVLAAAGSPELEPYRALARDPAACESVLAAARAGLSRGLDPGASPAAAVTSGPDWPGSPRPLYVTLAHGAVTRACVGTDVPAGGTLLAAVTALGEQLAASDRRHPPLLAQELDTLRLVVAFAGDAHAVADPLGVDPRREGLRIESARGAVAFLPGEARTVAWAIREARRIGMLEGPASEARFSRFAVVVLQGPARPRGTVRSRGEEP
jgi:hypothetical protein